MAPMLAVIFLLTLGVAIVFWRPRVDKNERKVSRFETQLDKLWDISRDSIKTKKYARAEKALLAILRVNERDARAYSHLGVLCAKRGEFADAIDCFEIAQSLEPSASALHNVGLIYMETDQLAKAEKAFEQAIALEGDVAARHIAYAKVLERTGQTKKMIHELERVVELEPNPQSVTILADALERDGATDRADKLRTIAKKMVEHGNRARIKQPRAARI